MLKRKSYGNFYIVKFETPLRSGTDNTAIWQLWNPSSTRRIALREFTYHNIAGQTASSVPQFEGRRSTARGTAGSTVTPDANHHTKRDAAPDSGFVIDLAAFSAEPTLDGSELWPGLAVGSATGNLGHGVIFIQPYGIEIPPGTGLVVALAKAIAWQTSIWDIVVEEL